MPWCRTFEWVGQAGCMAERGHCIRSTPASGRGESGIAHENKGSAGTPCFHMPK